MSTINNSQLTNSQDNSGNSQDSNQQLLNDIQSLQNIESELFNSLETTSGLTVQQQQQIIEKINQISNMRINLYQTLGNLAGYYQNTLQNSQGTLQEQSIAIGIVEKELNSAKQRLASLQDEKNNKIRLVEINTYYGDKYAEHSELMKILICVLVAFIILTLLKNNLGLPNPIYYGVVGIISIVGGYLLVTKWLSIINRDNMNYQQYAWSAPSDVSGNDASGNDLSGNDPWVANASTYQCVGSECCSDGQTYDTSLNQCVGDSTVETFVNNVLTKGAMNYKKPDVTLNNNYGPRYSESFVNFPRF